MVLWIAAFDLPTWNVLGHSIHGIMDTITNFTSSRLNKTSVHNVLWASLTASPLELHHIGFR